MADVEKKITIDEYAIGSTKSLATGFLMHNNKINETKTTHLILIRAFSFKKKKEPNI